MRISGEMGDAAVLEELGRRIARARLERNRTQAELATEAGIAQRTLAYLEEGRPPSATTLLRTLRALGLLERVDALVPDASPSPLELAATVGRGRRRATGTRRHPDERAEPWRWGDGR